MSSATAAADLNRTIEYLRSTSTYPDHPLAVQMVETHISWVFLTERYAYKLKKPVKFDFLDFTAPALRRQACLDELRLNRRLAPDVYIAVLPVTLDSRGVLQLAGSGTEIDWVVQMRRLPEDKALDRVLRMGRLKTGDADAVAQRLADFYTLLPAASVAPDEYRQSLARHIRANGVALLNALLNDQARIRRIQTAQLRYLAVLGEEIGNRVASGRVVDGHGDLRPEHIYLEAPPVVIDCVEFSEELRKVDVADELSFLAMECERLGAGSLGDLVLSTYQSASGDVIPPTMSAFYQCYRACVRAKVTLLRSNQQLDGRRRPLTRLTRQYIDWADHYAAKFGRPCLIVVGGLMGTGKSTLAGRIAEAFAADLLSTDHIRHSSLGASSLPAGYGDAMYQPEKRRAIYEQIFRQASDRLDQGLSAVLDGTFLTHELRSRAHDLGQRHGAILLEVICQCPRQTALSRIRKRSAAGRNDSEARADLYEAQLQEFEPPSADTPVINVDTTLDWPRQLQTVCDSLRVRLFD